MVNIGIFNIIIDKLGYWEKSYLVILFKIDNNSKIYFFYAILLFV